MLTACLTHWYESAIFFAPLPIVGLFVWLSGRRHMAADEREEIERRSSGTPGTAPSSATG